MKKLILILALVAVSLAGYSQATPGSTMRVSNTGTVLNQNLPAGVWIFSIADSTMWVTKAGVAKTYTVLTGHAAGKIMEIKSAQDMIDQGVMYSESFELAADDPNAAVTLKMVPLWRSSITVTLNGLELMRDSLYLTATPNDSTVTFQIPSYQFDKVTVIYLGSKDNRGLFF